MPDAADLIRVIQGQTVFGLDLDSRIRRAANGMTARLLVEMFDRCDRSKSDWQAEFAAMLAEDPGGDPSILVGFNDGRSQGRCMEPGETPPELPEIPVTRYLKLRFVNAEAAYYQAPLFPAMEELFIVGGGRKREGEFFHLRLDLCQEGDLQLFINGMLSNPHLVSVEESTEEIFRAAPSHRV